MTRRTKLNKYPAKNFRDWDKIQLSMKPPMPRESVVPWASQKIATWIFSMLELSASKRASATSVYLREGLFNIRVLNTEESPCFNFSIPMCLGYPISQHIVITIIKKFVRHFINIHRVRRSFLGYCHFTSLLSGLPLSFFNISQTPNANAVTTRPRLSNRA